MKNTYTNYKDIITKFVLNTVIHHVGMSWTIETNQQQEDDIEKHNQYWIIYGTWYDTSICKKITWNSV